MRAILAAGALLGVTWYLTRPRQGVSVPVYLAKPAATITNWQNELERYIALEPATKGYPMPEITKPAPTPIPAALWKTPANGMKYEPLFLAATKKYDLPPGLLSRIAWQESRYNPKAFNKASNASGIMQIVPKWHPGADPWKPEYAIPYAASYLARLYRIFRNWPQTIAAYNWGEGNLQKYAIDPYGTKWLAHVPAETYDYVTAVTRDTGVK